MKDDFSASTGNGLEVGTRAQVVTRNHAHEGMVGDITKIDPSGLLYMVSKSNTPFWAHPKDVCIVQPS